MLDNTVHSPSSLKMFCVCKCLVTKAHLLENHIKGLLIMTEVTGSIKFSAALNPNLKYIDNYTKNVSHSGNGAHHRL